MTVESDHPAPRPTGGFRLAPPFDALTVVWLKIVVCLPVAAIYALRVKYSSVTELFFWRQDLPVLLGCVALTAGLGLVRWPALRRPGAAFEPRTLAFVLAGACLVIGVAGAPVVFGGYRLSLDEFLADFDARIFAHGQFAAPIDPGWRAFVPALQPAFMLPAPSHDVWASAYLPINAAVRALAGTVGCAGWVNPFWTGLSVVAVFGVARKLWPERPARALVAAALLATSSQLLITGMTDYAMPAHLALNLCWLWLFLRGGRLGHAGALVIGFLACGLHQLVFHPLFAAPFIVQLWLDRRWRTAAFYSLGYGAIGLFWITYPSIALHLSGAAGPAAAAGAGWFATRVGNAFSAIRIDALGAMAESLVRFVAWQNPLTVPLALAGAAAAFRAKGHLRALAIGVILTILVVLIAVPSQTHGWGYRYLHGLLGSVCLIAAWSWTRLTDRLSPEARAGARRAFVAACAISLVLLTPLHAWQAWSYAAPYAQADAAIRAAPADVVIVDNGDGRWFDMGTLVRNDPYLERGPKVMLLSALDEASLRRLCATHSVATFDGANAVALGIDIVPLTPEPEAARLRRLMRQLNCGRPIA